GTAPVAGPWAAGEAPGELWRIRPLLWGRGGRQDGGARHAAKEGWAGGVWLSDSMACRYRWASQASRPSAGRRITSFVSWGCVHLRALVSRRSRPHMVHSMLANGPRRSQYWSVLGAPCARWERRSLVPACRPWRWPWRDLGLNWLGMPTSHDRLDTVAVPSSRPRGEGRSGPQ